MNLVGELVTVQARLSQKADTEGDPDLVAIAEEVETLTSGLRDNAMSIRMLQIGTTFATFRRLVRDLSGELGKTIELSTAGVEVTIEDGEATVYPIDYTISEGTVVLELIMAQKGAAWKIVDMNIEGLY